MTQPRCPKCLRMQTRHPRSRDLKEQLGGSADELLANVDQLDVIEELAGEFGNDAEKMGVVFANSEKAEKLRNLSKDLEGKGGDLLANIDQLDDRGFI